MIALKSFFQLGLVVLASTTTFAKAQTVLFSDSFNRVSGTPTENGKIAGVVNPLASTSWGSNDNSLGGTISQTFEIGPAIRDGNRHQYVDGDKARFRAGWAEIQHDWAADSRVISGGGLSIDFDATIADLSNGWLGLSIGQNAAASSMPGGTSGIFLPVNNSTDFGILFQGINSAGGSGVLQIFEGDDNPDAFVVAQTGDWTFGTDPNLEQHFRIEIATSGFGVNASAATANIFVTLAGSTRHVLTDYAFAWDADGEAYIALSSNKDQGAPGGTENPNQEVRIDNLVIATLNTVVAPQNTGDYNGDGIVDAADYTVWRDTLTQSVAPFSGADGDGSGMIDGPDYAFWKSKFGTNPGPGIGGVASVPEPSGLMLLLAAMGSPLVVRRLVNSQK